MVTKEVLGFTGKFYAVWNITISENEVCTGITRRFTKYIYKRKASKYLNLSSLLIVNLTAITVSNTPSHITADSA